MKIVNFFKNVIEEFRHVKWPTITQTGWLTAFVIVLTIAFAYYMGLFDLIFSSLIELVI